MAIYNCAPMPEVNHRKSSGGILRFGGYELDPRRGVLSRRGVPLKIQPQPLRVLELLVTRAPEVVTREELSDYVWGTGVNVDLDQSLNFCVRQIRSVLNDSASNPKFIDTLPKQGYRFVGDVVREVPPVSAAVAASVAGEPEPLVGTVPDAPGPVTRRTFAWSAVAVAAVAPFWSPDSQHIAFAAEGTKLKRIPAAGGSPVVLCDAVFARGGTWSRRGDILFGTADGPVFHVSASGGGGNSCDAGRQSCGRRFPLVSSLPSGWESVSLLCHNG